MVSALTDKAKYYEQTFQRFRQRPERESKNLHSHRGSDSDGVCGAYAGCGNSPDHRRYYCAIAGADRSAPGTAYYFVRCAGCSFGCADRSVRVYPKLDSRIARR